MISLLVALYIRISTAEQNADLQERELREYAASRGWTVVIVYSEVASGARRSRPRLAELLRDAIARKFQAVLVWKLDRISRSVLDLENIILGLSGPGCRLISITDHVDTSNESPMGVAFRQMLATFAQFERSLISERAAAGRKRYAEDMAAGRVGKSVHSRSGMDQPPGRPKRVFDRQAVFRLKKENPKIGIRAIAKKLGVGRMTVARVLKGVNGL